MNLLLDPRFAYPDLVSTAEAVVARTISLNEARALARKVTAGEVRQTSVGRARVVGPQDGATRALAELQAYANAHDQRSTERWAAFALMIEAQLGSGDLDPAAAAIGLSAALGAFDACVRATGASCPPQGVRFALQAADSLLESPACTDPAVRARLTAARTGFAACAT